MSDDTRYSITRKPQPRLNRDQVARAVEAPVPRPRVEPELALGSQPMLAMPEIAATRQAVLKVEFGDVELIIEHRGDEVSIIIPGALRMKAPRHQAMALIAALMKRP